MATVDVVGTAGAPTGRALLLLALLGAAVALMLAPSLIAAISMLDSKAMDGLGRWLGWSAEVRAYFGYGRVALLLPLLALLLRSREDQ